jgi:hypothetical protein
MRDVPLFLDGAAKATFTKTSAPIKLSDNVDNWQREVSSEIFKYLPFLSDYSVNVLIQRASPERGYAYGSAQVTNPAEGIQGDAQQQPVVIPIIVVDRMLKPLDVFFFGDKSYPLSEDRVREVLFDPRTFELSDRKPTDQGMVDQLYPPIRTNYGFGSGVTTGAAAGGAGFGKFASLMEAIAPTISEEDAAAFVQRLNDDPQLNAAIEVNPAFAKAAAAVVCERVSVEKTAHALVRSIAPTVVQFTKLASGNFHVKWANADAYSPQEADFTPSEAQDMAGTEAVQGMQPGQSVTMGTNIAKPPLDAPEQIDIKESGQYQVRIEETGAESVGWVLPVLNFDQTPMGLLLFTDGESYSLQDSMTGARVGNDMSQLPLGEPQGDGAFVYLRSDGSAVALPPVTVQNQTTDQDGNVGFICQTPFGDQVTLYLCPGLQNMQQINETDYCIPEDMMFMPLGQAIHVIKSVYDSEQVKQAGLLSKKAYIRSTGKNEFNLDGMPFHKLAKDRLTWLDRGQTEFLLVAAGLTQEHAREKIAKAVKQSLVEVDGLNTITPLDHVHQQAVKEASALLEKFPAHLRRDLVKIAATLEDTETADNILALNFLNPENVSTFSNYLPQLDETAQKLSEMLTASRLGLKQLDEGSIERAMHNTEEVIRGLKGLQQKDLL